MGHWLRLLNGYKDNSLIHVDITDNTGKFKEKVYVTVILKLQAKVQG